jgi:cytochrome c oxidase accessory protein FixG
MELPEERLATTDESGKRVYLYPASVKGFFQKRRAVVNIALVAFFLALPWIHVGGRQLLLLDVFHREFFIFGLHFRAHDAPLLLFLLLGFTLLIGFVTVVLGRAWCGWACPQTVFIEGVFRRIETLIEGSHRQRKALDEGPWTERKVWLKTLKYSAFLAVSLVITHSFLAYFVGSRELIHMVTSSPLENWSSFLVIGFTTALILFDFGWFREQFCVIMCPYGRVQALLLDSQSLVVGYDLKRGEPRRGRNPESQGDCVNCYRCVQVCPTGIDIRRGLQMECIACTACIDACDEVMRKIRKPEGLIRYTTQEELEGRKTKLLRPRSMAYAALCLIAVGGLLFALQSKDFLEVTLLRAKDSPYQLTPGPAGDLVINHFRLDLSNQTGTRKVVLLRSSAEEVELVMPLNPVTLESGQRTRTDFFLRFPLAILKDGSFTATVKMEDGGQERILEVTLVGPM